MWNECNYFHIGMLNRVLLIDWEERCCNVKYVKNYKYVLFKASL